MNPTEEAIFGEILQVEEDIQRRREIKNKNEKEESFSSKLERKLSLSDDTFIKKAREAEANKTKLSVATEFKASFNPGDLKEVEGGYQVEVLLLEDGYIPGRVVFQKGSTERAVEAWSGSRPKLLVNDSHVGIDMSIALGTLGAITDMRSEKFAGQGKDKKDRTRAYATVFLNAKNPITQYIVDTGREMNKHLKARGKEYAIFSVSAEVEFDRFAFTEFGDDFVFSADSYQFTGMAICFNPANLSSFGTADLSATDTATSRLADLNLTPEEITSLSEKIKKSPILSYLLSNSEMKSKLDNISTETEVTIDTTTSTEEVVVVENEVEAAEETSSDAEVVTEETTETETETEEQVETEQVETEETEQAEVETEVTEEADAETAETEVQAEFSVKLSALSDELSVATKAIETLKSENAKLSDSLAAKEVELSLFKDKLGSLDGELASRVPGAAKETGDKLSIAQRVSRHGK